MVFYSMGKTKSLFDDTAVSNDKIKHSSEEESYDIKKEVLPLDRLKNLDEKITSAVEKVKALKEEKTILEKKVKDFEHLLNEKNSEIELLKTEKTSIKNQVEELLGELETLEI